MGINWTESNKLKLLTTAIICDPGFNFNKKAVAEAWSVDDGEEPPTERAVVERFHKILNAAKDLEALTMLEKQNKGLEMGAATTKVEHEGVIAGYPDFMAASGGPPAKAIRRPASKPARSLIGKGTSVVGRKRKLKKLLSEDEVTTSMASTSDTDASVADSQTRKALPLRKSRPSELAQINKDSGRFSDGGVDAGAKPFDTDGSDGEYNYEKERAKKRKEMLKELKKARRV